MDSKGSSIQPRLPTYCHDGLLGIQISKEKVHEFFLPHDPGDLALVFHIPKIKSVFIFKEEDKVVL